jgi:hypothetical protein
VEREETRGEERGKRRHLDQAQIAVCDTPKQQEACHRFKLNWIGPSAKPAISTVSANASAVSPFGRDTAARLFLGESLLLPRWPLCIKTGVLRPWPM